MKDALKSVDVRQSVLMGIEHIRNNVDRERDCRPCFRFNLVGPPVWAQHEAADTPHTVGRFLHALNMCAGITELPDDAELLEGLRKLLFESCGRGNGFAWDDMGDPPVAYMHHQRETLLGLVAIRKILDDRQAESFELIRLVQLNLIPSTTSVWSSSPLV